MKGHANFAPPRDKRRVPPDLPAAMKFPPPKQGQPGHKGPVQRPPKVTSVTADYVGNDLDIGGSFPPYRISCMQRENIDTTICEIE